MIQVLLYPDALSLVGSMNAFEIYNDSKTDVVFALRYQGAEQNIVQHTYTPNDEHRITVDVKDIILPLLAFELKDDSTPYIQENIMKAFSVEIYEVGDAGNKKEFSFSVIRSGVDKLADSAGNFLKNNFLTWQPQVKAVTYYSPEFLTYYAAEACAVKCKAYLWNGTGYTESEITLAHLTEGCVYTIPVQYAIIAKALNQKTPSYYDVWVEKEGGDRLTYVQRYYASDMKSEEEEWFLFENSLGGVDCFRAYGNSENTAEHTHNVAEIEDDSEEYRVDTTRKFKKNTGYLDGKERLWLLDFFPSLGKYVYHRNSWRKITVTESDVNYEAKELPSNYTFTYKYSDARPYLNLSRASGESLKQMDIHLPDIGNFTIAPRLVEFPRQQLGGGVLFPVQDPHSEEWGTTTADAIFAAFLSAISDRYSGKGEVGHKHINISVLDALSFIGGYLLYKGEKLKAGVADVAKELDGEAAILKKYIRRDIDDTAEGTITFEKVQKLLQGLLVGEKFSFDAEGNIIAHSITADDFSEAGQKGFCLAAKEDGGYKLCIADILAWGLATIGALHVKGTARFDDTIGSPAFISGFLDGKGWRLKNEPITNAAGVQENKYNLELDNLVVRGTMRVFEMIVSQLLGENDNRIFTAMLEVDHYDPETGRVYLDTHEGRMYNPFRKDDYVMVQQYNGMPSVENNHYVTKRYELIVTEVGSEGEGEEMLAWVKFKNFTCSMEDSTPEQLITKRDTFVRVDNLTDPERKGIIQMMTVGSDTPYMDIIYGLKTDPDNALKGRLGNLQGITHPLFGALSGFGEFLQNLYATGDFVLRRTGDSIDTKIQMLQNQFATRFAQTSYEATEENNYLHNGQFLTATGSEDDSPIIDGWTIDDTDEALFWVDANGLPVMVNGAATVSGNRRVSIDNNEGRNMLHIQNSGVTQANDIIRKPGTHKEYTQPSAKEGEDGMKATGDGYQEVQDTLYVSARIYAKTAGTLTFGFEGCNPVNGKTNELSAQTSSVPYSAEWQTVQLQGKWNGTGNFVLRYTGDIYVSLLTITDEPLDNLSKTVSTQILQTASNIKLLGMNIDNVNGKTTQLGYDLDAEKGEIRQYVNEVDKNNREYTSSQITLTANSITSTVEKNRKDADGNFESVRTDIKQNADSITSIAKKVDNHGTSISKIQQDINTITQTVGKAATQEQLTANVNTLNKSISYNLEEAKKHANNVGIGIRNDYGSAITTVQQKKDSWSVASGMFDTNGNLTEAGITSITPTVTTIANRRIDDRKNEIRSGLVVTADFTALQTTVAGHTASISTSVQKDADGYITNALIKADRIKLEGLTTVNKYFKINTDGSMQASAGQIAGMQISGDGLTNEGFDNDAYIVLRNDTHKVFAGIGGNVLPASTGTRAVARFTNEESGRYYGDINYAIFCGAKGAATNVALDMTLGGYITGLRIKNTRLSSGGSSYNSPVAIPKGTNSVILGGSGYYQLPKMNKEDDGYVVFVKNDYDGAVYLRSNTSITSTGLSRTSFILYDRGSNTTDLVIKSRGDAMIFVYHRDVNIAGKENTKVGCWTQYKCPRDW